MPNEMPLRDEADLARLVPEAMVKGGSPSSASSEARLFLHLRARALRTVGPQHWTYVLAGFAWLQRSLVQLRSDLVIEHNEEDFQKVSKEVAAWLEATAPLCAEQRLSGLFASVRLEHNLGGGLAAWGYDPLDPLGNGLRSAQRLQEHGWRILPDGSVRALEDEGIGLGLCSDGKADDAHGRRSPARGLFCDGRGWR